MCRELGTSCFPVHLRSEVATKVKRNVNPLKSDFARADLIEAESIEALSLQDVTGHKALGFAVKTVQTGMLLLLVAVYIYVHFNNSK